MGHYQSRGKHRLITQQIRQIPIINEKGMMTDAFYLWMLSVSNLDPILGAGSPEGAVTATPGRLYVNTSGSAGSVLYVKQLSDISGDRSKGWLLV